MNPMPQLEPMLKQLRLSGILNSLEPRNRQAVEDKLAYTEFLALLIQDEIARREQRKLAMRMRRAGFQSQKTFESFDFSFNPSINQGAGPGSGHLPLHGGEGQHPHRGTLRHGQEPLGAGPGTQRHSARL